MSNKQFAERLNHELDMMGLPERLEERVVSFAKLLHIPRFQAEAMLSGIKLPDEKVMHNLARELEVSASWLLGKSDSKKYKDEA